MQGYRLQLSQETHTGKMSVFLLNKTKFNQVPGREKYRIDKVILKFICDYELLNTWHQYVSGGEKGNHVNTAAN